MLLEGQNIHGLFIEGARWESQFCLRLDGASVSHGNMESLQTLQHCHLKRWIYIINEEHERMKESWRNHRHHNIMMNQSLILGIDQIHKWQVSTIFQQFLTCSCTCHSKPLEMPVRPLKDKDRHLVATKTLVEIKVMKVAETRAMSIVFLTVKSPLRWSFYLKVTIQVHHGVTSLQRRFRCCANELKKVKSRQKADRIWKIFVGCYMTWHGVSC